MVAKHLKRLAYSITVISILLHSKVTYITKALEYKACLNTAFKYVCIDMCSLVMSLCLRNFIMISSLSTVVLNSRDW